jgi:hypothetical protein
MSLLLQLILLIISVYLLKSKLNVSDEGITYMTIGGISFSLIKNISLLILTFISGAPLVGILVSLLIDSVFIYLLMKQVKLI